MKITKNMIKDFLMQHELLSNDDFKSIPVSKKSLDIASNPKDYVKSILPELYENLEEKIIEFPKNSIFFELAQVASTEDSDDINTYTVKDSHTLETIIISIDPVSEKGYLIVRNESNKDINIELYSRYKALLDQRSKRSEICIPRKELAYVIAEDVDLQELKIILRSIG